MAFSPSVHTTLKESGVVGLMQRAIEQGGSSKRRICMTALAHLCCGVRDDAIDSHAANLLSQHDISKSIVSLMVGAATDGVSQSSTNAEGLSELAATCAALARTPLGAKRLVDAGLLPIVVMALHNKHGRSPYACLHLCRTLLFLSELPDLRSHLDQAGVPAVLKELLAMQPPLETRTSDEAKGCLLQLGQLEDQAAIEALRLSVPVEASGIDTGSNNKHKGFTWDVFLSHKRSDSKDFCRALHTLLVTRGMTVFLDFEWREELTQLQSAVAGSRVFIFVLSDNVLQSEWCIKELLAAVQSGSVIVLLTKDGARWSDGPDSPHKNQLFPLRHEIEMLPLEVQSVFLGKPIVHSDEYYAAFVEQLMDRVHRGISKQEERMALATSSTPPVDGTAVAAGPTSPAPHHQRLITGATPPVSQVYESSLSRTALSSQQLGDRVGMGSGLQTTGMGSLPSWAQQHIMQLQQQVWTMQSQSSLPAVSALPSPPEPQLHEQGIHSAVTAALRQVLLPELGAVRQLVSSDLQQLRQQLTSEAAAQQAALRQELTTSRWEMQAEMRLQIRQVRDDVSDLGRSLGNLSHQCDMLRLQQQQNYSMLAAGAALAGKPSGSLQGVENGRLKHPSLELSGADRDVIRSRNGYAAYHSSPIRGHTAVQMSIQGTSQLPPLGSPPAATGRVAQLQVENVRRQQTNGDLNLPTVVSGSGSKKKVDP